jgi:hypothetical protein
VVVNSLGIELENLCKRANREILLVAPFIKKATLQRLLTIIPEAIALRCITRWKPEEIARGVSDLEIWYLLKESPNFSLALRSDLHAKYYRVDEQCLIGSANLTHKGLGWSTSSNFELLVPLPAETKQLKIFEEELLKECVEVDQNLFNQVSETVQLLRQQFPESISLIYESQLDQVSSNFNKNNNQLWMPTLRYPECLYSAYLKQWEKLTSVTQEAANQDLNAFSLPSHLSEDIFNRYIGMLLLQTKVVRKIDHFVKIPQRFGAVRNFLLTLDDTIKNKSEASYAWQTLMRWLLYFLPNRYAVSIPNYSEIFYRIDT